MSAMQIHGVACNSGEAEYYIYTVPAESPEEDAAPLLCTCPDGAEGKWCSHRDAYVEHTNEHRNQRDEGDEK